MTALSPNTAGSGGAEPSPNNPAPDGQSTAEGSVYVDLSPLRPDQRADIEAHLRGLSEAKEDGTYTAPREGWTCFHCGETFHTLGGARLHFGEMPTRLPSCIGGGAIEAAIRTHVRATFDRWGGSYFVGVPEAVAAILALAPPPSAAPCLDATGRGDGPT